MPNSSFTAAMAAASITDPGVAANTENNTADAGGENRLLLSVSPYVRSHANDLVRWHLLDDEAVSLARSQNKQIFLHIGYPACHFCRLTGQDSFNHPWVADFLNANFIPVIVDRDERPDINRIYQAYSEGLTGRGGWPLHVCLTPELLPTFAGTYWPGPGTEHAAYKGDVSGGGGAASEFHPTHSDWSPDSPVMNGNNGEEFDFLVAIKRAHAAWVEKETIVRTQANEMVKKLREVAQEGVDGVRSAEPVMPNPAAGAQNHVQYLGGGTIPVREMMDLDLEQLDEALKGLTKIFDLENGGFGSAPKFPLVPKLSFLLRLNSFPQEVADALDYKNFNVSETLAMYTLRHIRKSGLRDHIEGGFHRYSQTRDWSQPRFEKMTQDNALLLGVYLDAWLTSSPTKLAKSDEFADVVVELAEYLVSLSIPGSGFATSEASDSKLRESNRHMQEGAYYLWTRREFDAVVGEGEVDRESATAIAAAYYNVLEDGNVDRAQDPHHEFLNQNVLRISKMPSQLSRNFGVPIAEVERIVTDAKAKLLQHRQRERVRPARDEKMVTAVNGMAISALARTAGAIRFLDSQQSGVFLGAARSAADFIKNNLWDQEEKVLYRIWDDGRRATRAFAEDYAFLIEGLLDLDEVLANESFVEWARELQDTQIRLFYDSPDRGLPSQLAPVSAEYSRTGGFYSSEASTPHAILRLKEGMDTDRPSTNGVTVNNLYRLYLLLGGDYDAYARETLMAFEPAILEHPGLFPGLLTGIVSERLRPEYDPDTLRKPRAEARVGEKYPKPTDMRARKGGVLI